MAKIGFEVKGTDISKKRVTPAPKGRAEGDIGSRSGVPGGVEAGAKINLGSERQGSAGSLWRQ